MAKGRILVIAPEADLRRSLEFALEAEGYLVDSQSSIDATETGPAGPYDCTVLDERAVTLAASDILAFCMRAGPVVLLSNFPIAWLSGKIAGRVEKPTLGRELSVAVMAAMQPP
jgi:DNA-binding NtrC family response regulator